LGKGEEWAGKERSWRTEEATNTISGRPKENRSSSTGEMGESESFTKDSR
jgi:hypothetical protein